MQMPPFFFARVRRHLSILSFRIRHWSVSRPEDMLPSSVGARETMRFFLLVEGVVAMVAAVSAYLWGYLDGRAEIRSMRKKMVRELRDFD